MATKVKPRPVRTRKREEVQVPVEELSAGDVIAVFPRDVRRLGSERRQTGKPRWLRAAKVVVIDTRAKGHQLYIITSDGWATKYEVGELVAVRRFVPND